MISLDAAKLKHELGRALQRQDLDAESLEHVCEAMVETSLRGVDSHGVNLFPHYHRALLAKRVNRQPKLRFEQTAPSVAILDADHAYGHHACAAAMDHACELASATGIAAVAVRDSTHFGAAAYYALRAADRDFLGFSFTNADALVKAWNGTRPFFGTNPVCIAAPLASEAPLCLDMATSVVSWNKVLEHRRIGRELPDGWAHDAAGQPTRDPHAARCLAPAGGYKGFGLGMFVEVLCGLLANGPAATELLPMYSSPIEARRRISHHVIAVDIAKFVPGATFKQRLQAIVDGLRAMAPLAGDAVMVPGDPEKQRRRERIVSGIPMTEERFAEFVAIANDFERAVIG